MIRRRSFLPSLIVCALIMLFALMLSMLLGSVPMGIESWFQALTGRGDARLAIIVRDIRFPRALGAALAGMALASAGLLLQAATDNDLCAPNVIGVNAGAGFQVMLVLCLLPSAFRLLPLFAFFGALLTSGLVLLLSFSSGRRSSKATVVLAGVAVSALFNAGISYLSLRYPDALSSYAAFSAGGFAGLQLNRLGTPALLAGIAFVGALMVAPSMNLLCMGDDQASALGVRVRRTRVWALVLASALCAAAVSFAGLIGFVGLIVPHITRALMGNDLRKNLPLGALMGATLTLMSDLAGRTLFAPSEVPAGILLSAIGAPFFIYLLLRRRRA